MRFDLTPNIKVEENRDEIKKVVKLDCTSQSGSAITYNTDASSFYRNPSTIGASETSTKLEMQLKFLARELEMERHRREKLQNEVKEMSGMLAEQ